MVRMIIRGEELVLPSSRQLEVLALLVEGQANKEIAYRLGIQECTVKRAVGTMLMQLRFSNRVELAAWALSRPAVFAGEAVSPAPYRRPVRAALACLAAAAPREAGELLHVR